MLSGQTLALAEPAPAPAQKLSKPLNLKSFAKAPSPPQQQPRRQAARSEPPPALREEPTPVLREEPEPAAHVPQAPITTATVGKAAASPATTGSVGDPRESDATQFCRNVADAALDARIAWQQKELEATEVKLRQRIAELEAKRSEYERWLKLRDDFLKKAEDSVVEIYSRMDPDAAAAQLASMADNTAAAVLAKLRPQNASAILNEMDAGRAAHLADTLAGMRRPDDEKATK